MFSPCSGPMCSQIVCQNSSPIIFSHTCQQEKEVCFLIRTKAWGLNVLSCDGQYLCPVTIRKPITLVKDGRCSLVYSAFLDIPKCIMGEWWGSASTGQEDAGTEKNTCLVFCLWLWYTVYSLVTFPSKADRLFLRLEDVPFVFQRLVNLWISSCHQ